MKTFLAFDVALRHTGWVYAEQNGRGWKVFDCGVISPTIKAIEHLEHNNVSNEQDLARRCRQLFDGLGDVFAEYEAPTFAECPLKQDIRRAATAIDRIGRAHGVFACASTVNVTYVPQHMPKQLLCGSSKAKKERVELAVRGMTRTTSWDVLLKGVAESKHNHVFDAFAVGVVGSGGASETTKRKRRTKKKMLTAEEWLAGLKKG